MKHQQTRSLPDGRVLLRMMITPAQGQADLDAIIECMREAWANCPETHVPTRVSIERDSPRVRPNSGSISQSRRLSVAVLCKARPADRL